MMVMMMECMAAVMLWLVVVAFEAWGLVDGLYIDISVSFEGSKHAGTITSLFRFIFQVFLGREAANERAAAIYPPSKLWRSFEICSQCDSDESTSGFWDSYWIGKYCSRTVKILRDTCGWSTPHERTKNWSYSMEEALCF
jgi:hypothetical protein